MQQRLEATLARDEAELDAQRRGMAVLDTQERQLRADLQAKHAAVDLASITPAKAIFVAGRIQTGRLLGNEIGSASIQSDVRLPTPTPLRRSPSATWCGARPMCWPTPMLSGWSPGCWRSASGCCCSSPARCPIADAAVGELIMFLPARSAGRCPEGAEGSWATPIL